jgi:hypothetical protein
MDIYGAHTAERVCFHILVQQFIGIQLRELKNDKKPPICAFLAVYNISFPIFRDSRGLPFGQQNQQLKLVGGCNAVKSRDLKIGGRVRSPPPLPTH